MNHAFDPHTVHHLVHLWLRIATAEGALSLSPLARRTCTAYVDTVLGHVFHADMERSPPRGPVPGLVPHLAHLALAMVVDAPLDIRRVEAFSAIARAAGVEVPVVRDLRLLCRLKVAGPRMRITARILQERFQTSVPSALWRTFKLQLKRDARAEEAYAGLAHAPEGSFGAALARYYDDNEFPVPGARGGYPVPLVAVHDVAHVLGGFDTTHTGELLVGAFESGASPQRWVDYWVGGMLHCQLGIQLEPGAEPALGQFPPERFYEAFSRGRAASSVVVDPHWDFWHLIELPLPDARARLGIAGPTEVQDGDRWCGPSGPPYQRKVPEPLQQPAQGKTSARRSPISSSSSPTRASGAASAPNKPSLL